MSRAGAGAEKASTYGDRLRFVIWLSALKLGTDSAKELSAVLGKGSTQLSKWVMENPKPVFATTKRIADLVGVSPSWLDDPASSDAREPELFAQWLAARRAREREAAAAREGGAAPARQRRRA